MQRAMPAVLIAALVLTIGRTASAQDRMTVSGTDTTRADGLSVPGAAISVIGADATATTDAAGRYTLQIDRTVAHGDRIQSESRCRACRRRSSLRWWICVRTGRTF